MATGGFLSSYMSGYQMSNTKYNHKQKVLSSSLTKHLIPSFSFWYVILECV